MRYALASLITAVVFLALDFGWLTLMGQRLYQAEIGQLLAKSPRLAPAIAFYLIYVAGLVFFAVRPGLEGGDLNTVALNAAVMGFVAYATYDLTNQATMTVWSLKVTLADLAWGVFVSTAAATAGTAATLKLMGRA